MPLADDRAISQAAETLLEGGTVVFPTETVYGLGADARNADACARIFAIKERPRFNPLICHLAELSQLESVCAEIGPDAAALAARFWPGPLTLVLPKKAAICDLATAGLPTVGVRIPQHPLALQLLRKAGIPVAAPSANRFTRLSPTRVEHARAQLGERVDRYLDGGPCSVGLESTIIGWHDGRAVLLRPGGVVTSEIEKVIGPVSVLSPAEEADREEKSAVIAPGMLRRHYSPATPLRQRPPGVTRPGGGRTGLLVLRASPAERAEYTAVEELSPEGDLKKAAARLFQALRSLETQNLDRIDFDRVPDTGLGLAINDRLWRAACP